MRIMDVVNLIESTFLVVICADDQAIDPALKKLYVCTFKNSDSLQHTVHTYA